MSDHVFISYSHHGAASRYVEKLAAFLVQEGFSTWYDKEIITGERWAQVVRDRIDTCGAFIVIMTPHAESSGWVSREIDQAQQEGKPILPLLLEGKRFFVLADRHYENVIGMKLPSAAFVAQLRTILGRKTPPPRQTPRKPITPPPLVQPVIPTTTDPVERGRMLNRLVYDSTRSLGSEHPTTLTYRHELACWTGTAGNPNLAAHRLREIAAARTHVLGPFDPDTLASQRELAFWTDKVNQK